MTNADIDNIKRQFFTEDAKFFGFDWAGSVEDVMWFVFTANGSNCWFVEKKTSDVFNMTRATAKDWMYISPTNSRGFVGMDFKGCNLNGFNLSGTVFRQCEFEECGISHETRTGAMFDECTFHKVLEPPCSIGRSESVIDECINDIFYRFVTPIGFYGKTEAERVEEDTYQDDEMDNRRYD